jgi:ATP-dependent DNA ligase
MFTVTDLLKPKVYNGQPVSFAQVKQDGIRLMIRKWVGGKCDAMTRTAKTNLIDKIPCDLSRLPEGSVLDCELFVPGEQSTAVSNRLATGGQLSLNVFAVPRWDNTDTRDLSWDEAASLLLLAGLDHLAVETRQTDGSNAEELLAIANRRGLEGWVMKNGHYREWYKLKPALSVDAVVMDVATSYSDTFFGGLKGVSVGLYRDGVLTELTSVGSGFTTEYRRTVDKQSLIGRVCEVGYDSVAANGSLRFPRFLRWRDDKPREECDFSQLEAR